MVRTRPFSPFFDGGTDGSVSARQPPQAGTAQISEGGVPLRQSLRARAEISEVSQARTRAPGGPRSHRRPSLGRVGAARGRTSRPRSRRRAPPRGAAPSARSGARQGRHGCRSETGPGGRARRCGLAGRGFGRLLSVAREASAGGLRRFLAGPARDTGTREHRLEDRAAPGTRAARRKRGGRHRAQLGVGRRLAPALFQGGKNQTAGRSRSARRGFHSSMVPVRPPDVFRVPASRHRPIRGTPRRDVRRRQGRRSRQFSAAPGRRQQRAGGLVTQSSARRAARALLAAGEPGPAP